MDVMSIIKIEVSIPEAVSTLEKFKKGRLRALDELGQQFKASFSNAINQLLNLEMDIFLGGEEQSSNKRNGYKNKTYFVKGVGSITLRVPKDRLGKFESAVVAKHERTDPRVKQDVALLHLAGISNRSLAMISKRILGIKLSKDTIQKSLELVSAPALSWLSRPLNEVYWALYIDGTNFKIQRRGSTEREPALVVLGITESGHRSILAIEPGQKDSAQCWQSVFGSLKQRGLDPLKVRIGIMDGLPGLEKVFKENFANAVTARCWVHANANALNRCPKRLRVAMKAALWQVMNADSENDARKKFDLLKAQMGSDGKRAVETIEKDLDSLLAHYAFEKRFWRTLRTTNPIERVNKEFKRRTKAMETVGEQTLNVVLAFIALKLEFGWRMYTVDDQRHENLDRLQNRLEMAAETLLH